jgi:hypothetical protein
MEPALRFGLGPRKSFRGNPLIVHAGGFDTVNADGDRGPSADIRAAIGSISAAEFRTDMKIGMLHLFIRSSQAGCA